MVLLYTNTSLVFYQVFDAFCEIIIVKENKTSINNAASHFQLFLTLFQNKRNKMHQNSISFSKQQQEISLITTLPFSSQCSTLMWGLGGIRQVCGHRNVMGGMLGDTSILYTSYSSPCVYWPWWLAPDITCCCCGAGEEMLMEFEMMLKSRAGDWSDECIPTWEQPSLYFHLLWKCNV